MSLDSKWFVEIILTYKLSKNLETHCRCLLFILCMTKNISCRMHTIQAFPQDHGGYRDSLLPRICVISFQEKTNMCGEPRYQDGRRGVTSSLVEKSRKVSMVTFHFSCISPTFHSKSSERDDASKNISLEGQFRLSQLRGVTLRWAQLLLKDANQQIMSLTRRDFLSRSNIFQKVVRNKIC